MSISGFALLAFLWLLPLHAGAAGRDASDPYWQYRYGDERGDFDYDDSRERPWREFAAEIPPLPDTNEFVPLKLDSLPQGMRAFVHLPTLSVGEQDAVVRYWVLLTGQAGGFNASYEGVKCNTGEFKVYAYGHPKRQPTVRVLPHPKWQARKAARHQHRDEITRDYLCAGVTPRTRRQIEFAVLDNTGYEDPLTPYQH